MKYHHYWKEKPPELKKCLFAAYHPMISPDGVKCRIRFIFGVYKNGKIIDLCTSCTVDQYEFDRWITLEELDDILMEYRD